jgi:hypothetical protein
MLVNLALMLLLVNFTHIQRWILWFIFYLAASGFIGIVNGTDTAPLFIKELLGISISVIYFYFFFKLIGNDFEQAFTAYARIAFWFAVIALPIWLGNCIYFHSFVRLQGLTSEPTAFCGLILPSYYWYTYHYFTNRRHGVGVAVFTLAIILSGSSNGFLCVGFGAMLLLSKRMKHLIVFPIAVGGIFGLAYTASPDVQLRVNDTFLAAATQDVSGSNLSTYALMSNLFVAQQVLKESPVIGNGLGSHSKSHSRFIRDIPGVESFIETGTGDLNAPDAASLAIRILSELGILGFSAVLIFLFCFYVGGSGPHSAICNAILVSVFLKLLRSGHYFPPDQFFLVFIYILNYRKHKLEALLDASCVSSMLSPEPLGACLSNQNRPCSTPIYWGSTSSEPQYVDGKMITRTRS